MISSYTFWLLQPHPRIPMIEPEFMEHIELSGELHAIALSEPDQHKADIIDAASIMVLRDQETIDMLRAELKALQELRQ